MKTIEATERVTLIPIGKQGENNAVSVVFRVSDWLREFGETGTFTLIHRRAGDETPYPVDILAVTGGLKWIISDTDNANVGYGECELMYSIGDVIKKSATWITKTTEALAPVGDTPPDPYESWYENIVTAGERASQSAAEAAESTDYAEEAKNAARAYAESALEYRNAAEGAKNTAVAKAAEASASAGNAAASALAASASETNAAESERQAGLSKDAAAVSAQSAGQSELAAQGYAEDAEAAAVDIQNSIDGVAQEDTAQSMLDILTSISALLNGMKLVLYVDELPETGTEGMTYITPDGVFHCENGEYIQVSGSGDLNGFSLARNADGSVTFGYTNPDDETDTDSVILPTNNTAEDVLSAFESIADSLAIIAGQN